MQEGLYPMANDYNVILPELYARVFNLFGIITYPEAANDRAYQENNISLNGVQLVDQEELEQELSYLNTPIIFPMTFKGDTYKVLKNGEVAKQKVDDFRLPSTAVASFSRKKIKAKTRAVGGKGSVKELYGFDDWQITINGFCLNDPKHPQGAVSFQDQVDRLLEFENLADSVEVLGSLFRGKGIYRMDIDQIDFPAVVGKPRYVPFTIIGESDEPLELIL